MSAHRFDVVLSIMGNKYSTKIYIIVYMHTDYAISSIIGIVTFIIIIITMITMVSTCITVDFKEDMTL